MTTKKSAVSIKAPQDWELSGALFENAHHKDGPVILLSGAAAIPHGFYSAFAEHLTLQGAAAVLTYDYRGMGSSQQPRMRWPELRMKDWAVLDFPAAAHFLHDTYPDHPLVGVGHSYGGQALGLSGVSDMFERYATVATMSGYWRGTDEPFGVWMKTQLIGKAFAKVMGRLPKWGGLGEEMPGSIFLDWGRWIAKPDYFFSDPHVPETARFSDVALPYLALGLRDDTWATQRAVDDFMAHYTNADLRTLWITPPQDKPIGHFAYFRPRNADHWPVVTNFALQGTWPEGALPQTS